MAEATGSLSFRDLTLAVATRKKQGIQFPGDWPTETEIATATWAGHDADEITLADRILNDAKRIVNVGYKRFLIAHDWQFLTTRTTLTGWVTNTETAVGAPTFAAPSSTVTVDTAMFFPSMLGQTLTFGTSETEWVIDGFTSTTVVTVTGDASGEVAAQEITVTATGFQRLPDNFGGQVVDEKMYFAPDALGPAIQEVPMSQVLDLRGRRDLTVQFVWSYALETVQVGHFTRWNVNFGPRWNADTVVHYRYRTQIDILTSASVGGADVTDYPLGGAEFSTVIREACMMMVEEDRGFTKGPVHESYNTTLAQGITRDSRNKPRNRGKNSDNSDGPVFRPRRVRSVTFIP